MLIRQRKIQGLRFVILLMSACLAFVFFSVGKTAQAQQRLDMKAQGRRTEAASVSKLETEPVRLRAQLSQARSEYKSSLEQLLSLYEAGAKRAEERLPKMKELYEQGLVTRRDMETAEDAAARASEKVVEAQAQLKSAEVQFAEVVVEAEAEESAPKVRLSSAPRAAVGGLLHTTAYIRFGGARVWSLSEAGAIRQFFMQRFGRALPVGAFGQSPIHDRWGYDHRNAMDVGLSPDSAEGQVLMEYLRANGIPFTAFHFAVPGKATGPHIHVGLPSHKLILR
ncbi:MAG: TolC family protein [Pyrinomonadaceae bacterium]